MTAGRIVTVQNVRVHLAELRGLAHDCRPVLCSRMGTCCSQYLVTISERKLSRLVGMIPLAEKYARHLARPDVRHGCFEEGPDGLELGTDDDGLCHFAFRRDGAVLCSLHAAALEHGLEPYATKPQSCSLWPLMISTSRPRELAVMPDAWDYPCNRRRRGKTLHAGVVEILRKVFGEPFAAACQTAAAEG
jgi:hypothetical protein